MMERIPSQPGPPHTSPRPDMTKPQKARPSPISDEQAIQIARKAVENALADGEYDRNAHGGEAMNKGITVDLSRSAIKALPNKVMDIINIGIER